MSVAARIASCFAVILSIAGLLPSSAEAAPVCLRIGVGTGGAYVDETAALVTNIFDHAGYCVKIVLAPQNRINVLEADGDIDGDAWRYADYLEGSPVLLKVPTAIQHFSSSLYWRTEDQEPTGPDATIGIFLGKSWARQALRDRSVKIFEAGSYEQLFQLLLSRHIQGFVMPTLSFEKLTREREDTEKFQAREILNRPLYLAINRRHKAMIPALDKAIKALWADGTISDQPTAVKQ